MFGDADIILQRVEGREDADMTIVVAAIVIIELRHVALHEYLLAVVVERALQRNRFSKVHGHAQETLNPVGLGDGGLQREIIVSMLLGLGQSGQGRNARCQEVGEALWQRVVVKVATNGSLAKVTLHIDIVHVALIAKVQEQLVEVVRAVMALHGEVGEH